MRRFRDHEDRGWEVVVGRESWGAFFAIFAPRGHDSRIRQTPLEAKSQDEAAREIESLDRESLLELLEESKPKDLG